MDDDGVAVQLAIPTSEDVTQLEVKEFSLSGRLYVISPK
jgi:hypothetical protein